MVSYKTSEVPIYTVGAIEKAANLPVYDSIDSDVLQSYMEYSLASLIYYCLKEGACSEQSSRMTAMDNSSKNAGKNSFGIFLLNDLGVKSTKFLMLQLISYLFFTGEMIDKLTLSYNRTRQAVITGELIEIISGAAAL